MLFEAANARVGAPAQAVWARRRDAINPLDDSMVDILIARLPAGGMILQ